MALLLGCQASDNGQIHQSSTDETASNDTALVSTSLVSPFQFQIGLLETLRDQGLVIDTVDNPGSTDGASFTIIEQGSVRSVFVYAPPVEAANPPADSLSRRTTCRDGVVVEVITQDSTASGDDLDQLLATVVELTPACQ